MNHKELEPAVAAMQEYSNRCLVVGFNRRFSPQTVMMKNWLIGTAEPTAIILSVKAGEITADHWTQDLQFGGNEKLKKASQDKVRKQELSAFVDAVSGGGDWPTQPEQLIEVSRVTSDISDQVDKKLATPNGRQQ